MQELYIDRQPCDLDENTIITLDIKSNIFTMVDKIESNRTYSVELPRTDTNMRIVGNSDLLGANTIAPYTAHTCTYISDGIRLIDEGTAYIMSIGERIRLSVVWGVKDTLQSILTGEVKITDLEANAVLAYTYVNTNSTYNTMQDLLDAGYIYAEHDNIKLPEDRHHETDVDIRTFAYNTYRHPIVPVVRVPWLLSLVTSQYGIGFDMPVSVQNIVDRMVVFVSGTNVTEKSVSGTELVASSTNENIIYSTNGLSVDVTTASLEFTNEDDTAINVGDNVNRFKVVADTTCYVSVSSYTLQGSISMTPNNIELLGKLLNTPIFAHNITQGDYKRICLPTMTADGVSVFKVNELLQWQGQTKTIVFTYNGAVEVQMSDGDVLRLWHPAITYSGMWDALNFTMDWQTGGTLSIAYDIPDKMTVGLDYDIMANLPDVKVIDLLKHIAVVTGCFVRSLKADASVLEFVPIADVYSNSAKDWSDRLLSARTATADAVAFTFGDYAQVNHYKYKENDALLYNHDGQISIGNGQLANETDVFTSVFSAVDRFKTQPPLTLKGSCPYIALPSDWYDVYTGEKTAPVTDAEKLCEGTPPSTIALVTHVEHHNADNTIDYYDVISDNTEVDLQAVLDTKYPQMYATLNNCKVITERMMLSDIDIRDFVEDTPVYLSKYGQTFAVLEIKRTSGNIAEVKMIMLTTN